MRRNVTLLFLLFFGFIGVASAQCPPYLPAPDCPSAQPDCSNGLDGYCNTLGTDPGGGAFPGCGGAAVLNNDEWIAFFAGSSSITVQIVPDNCQGSGANGGTGIQAGFYQDCNNLDGSVLSVQCNCTENIVTLNSTSFVIGETYYITIDGCGGDVCDYEINVINGETTLPPPPDPTIITGPTTGLCPGSTATYTVDQIFSIVDYNWQVTGGSIISQNGNTVTVQWNSSGTVSVFGQNGCYTTATISLPVDVQPLPPVDDFGEYCAGSAYIYPGNGGSYTQGSYPIVFPGASFQGCDSTVILNVTENPTYFIDINRTICQGDVVEVNNIPYDQTGTYQNTIPSIDGCDSTVFLDLLVLSPQAVVNDPGNLGCGINQTLVDGSISLGDSFEWSSPDGGFICAGQGTPLITACAPGTYCLTVTSFGFDNGQPVECTSEQCVVVNEVIDEPELSVVGTDVTCPNAEDGTATVTITSGGVSPFIYIWNTMPIQAGPTASGLEGGTYTVTVTGANNCTQEISVNIAESTPMTLDMASSDSDCNNDPSGSATVTPSGGAGGYSYAWNTSPVQNGPTATGLTAGTYTVVVTDANDCTEENSVVVGEPTSLTATVTPDDADCNGEASGSATATPSGGAGGYLYAWSTSPVQDDATATGLTAGTYTVEITDANGCTVEETVVIGEPVALTATTSSTPVGCNGGDDGTATASPSGGTGAYNYSWDTNPAQGNATATGLTAGTYTVSIEDANGCEIIETVIVTEPDGLSVVPSAVNVECNGGNDGEASVSVSGGSGSYDYTWNTVPVQNGPTATGLTAGTYEVAIEDGNGCEQIETIVVTQPDAITATVTFDNVSCNSLADGTATASASGGTGNLSYSWNTVPVQNGPTATGLTAGTYTVEITDENDCTILETVTIIEPTDLAVAVTQVNVDCNGANTGSATATPSGGTGPYDYAWSTSPVQDDATATGLVAGTYTVEITDASGCTETETIIITEPDAIVLTVDGNDPDCFDSLDGTATASASGGTGTLSYEWDTNPVQNGPTATGLDAGTYTVEVTDENGCTVTETIILIAPTALTLTTTQVNVLCFGESTGSATANPGGGTPPYTYSWTDAASQNTQTAVGLPEGDVDVEVMDANGCTITTTVTITQPAAALSATGTSTDASCGDTNGTIDLTVTGGTAPYSFDWGGAAPDTGNPTNLGPGTYTAVVTDANDCTTSVSVTVNTPSGLAATIATTNVSCNGLTDGVLDVTVTGGTAPYTYAWSVAGQNDEDLNLVGAGNYSITITDADGCSITASDIVTEPDVLMATATASQASCGGSDGSVSLVVSGGAGGYTFNWNNNTYVDQSPQDLPPGTYDVIVTDLNGCTVEASADVTVPDGPVVSFTSINADCNDSATGSIDLDVVGGTEPYTFTWTGGPGPIEDPSGLTAGTYDVEVVDVNDCSATASITITEPDALQVTLNITDVTCFGANDGTVTANVIGGTPPYSYAWCDGQTGPFAINCPPGNCPLVVTDANGCDIIVDVVVNEPPVLEAVVTVTNAACNGEASGAIDLEVSGGVGLYTYQWSGGAINDEDQAALLAGSYDVIVTDGNGCTTEVAAITVDEPAAIDISSMIMEATCNEPNGSIDLTVTGGTSPYTFDWGAGVDPVEDPQGLLSGVYNVLVTDANGCTSTETVDVTTPTALSVSAVPTNTNCNGDNSGSIDVTVSGGEAPFTYQWDNGLNDDEDQASLFANTYNVTVTDATGCTFVAVATVDEPDAIAISSTSADATCGDANGSIDLTVTGGTAPYAYAWDNAAPIEDPNSLLAGNYEVTVTDANDCTAVYMTVVDTPAELLAQAEPAPADCNGAATGAIELTLDGGTGPFTYAWTGGLMDVEDPTDVPAGTYTVIVTDANDCTVEATAQVTEPEAIDINFIFSEATCNLDNGSIDLTVTGGTAPYTFDWGAGVDPVEDPQNLFAGSYDVIVTDANDCTATETVTVTTPTALAAAAVGTDASCFASASGSIDLTVSGGVAPFTFEWDNTPQDIEDPIDLPAGTYTVIVTDATDCTITATAIIGEPTEIEITGTSTDATCGSSNGTINLTVSGGTAPYTYTWNGAPPVEDPTDLIAGTYDVTVTDANDCTMASFVIVNTPNQLQALTVPTDADCNGAATGSIDLQVSGGTPPFTYIWSGGLGFDEDPTDVPADVYSVIVTDADGCSVIAGATVDQPDPISATSTFQQATCGDANGSINLQVSGGTAPYIFDWDNADDIEDPANLLAGTYNVLITDVNDCTFTYSVEITTPTELTAFVVESPANCAGEANGAVDLTVGGGVEPYTYDWSNTDDSEDLTGVPAGPYSVIVTDAVGCTIEVNALVDEPGILEVFLTGLPTSVSCNGGSDGDASLTVNGGIPGYSFDWSDNTFDGQQEPSNMPAGSYTVTVTDLNGCTATTSLDIAEPDPIILAVSAQPTDCFGSSEGAIDLDVVGGTTPYTYNWNAGAYDVQDPTNVTAGFYGVVVTDNNGCTAAISTQVEQPDAIQIAVDEVSDYAGFNLTCADAADGFVTVSAEGGSLPYAYDWSNGGDSPTITDLGVGTYDVIVSDANDCTSELSVSLTGPESISSSFFAVEPSCYEENDGQIVLDTVFGGSAPYVYSIDGNSFSSLNQFNNLVSDTYDVVVQDANGCETTQTITVTQPEELMVDLGGDESINLGDSIQLSPFVTPAFDLDTIFWRQSELIELEPWVRPFETSTYSIIAINNNGCIAEDEITVRVIKDRLVYIPNAFTPNGDGNNDYFSIYIGTGVTLVKSFRVFNRWGEVVFERDNFVPTFEEEGWDGSFRGEIMNPGVFVYFAEVEFLDGRVEKYKGDVTLTK